MRKYLIELREAAGMSQEDVAKKIGISRQYYSMIEAGDRQQKMDITLANRIAAAFGIELVSVINYENALEA